MKKYKYSLIVPVFNAEKYLDKCISSILNQTYDNIEVILVDDGSTDYSLDICKNYEKRDKRVKVISQKNGGVSNARNNALNNITGDFLSFIDSDDYIEEKTVEIINDILEKYQVDLVKFSYVNEIGFLKKRYGFCAEINKKIERKDYDSLYFNALKNDDLANVCNTYISRHLIEGLSFNEKLSYSEDRTFMIELFLKSNSIFFIDDCLYHYVVNPKSASHKRGSEVGRKKLDDYLASFILISKSIFNRVGVLPTLLKPVENILDDYISNYNKLSNYKNYKKLVNEIFDYESVKKIISYDKNELTDLEEAYNCKEKYNLLKKNYRKRQLKELIKKIFY